MSDFDCVWTGCLNYKHPGFPVCYVHAYQIYRHIDASLQPDDTKVRIVAAPVVYYLALLPTTVKIGHTTDLAARMRGLRTSVQYVLATEPGGRDVERMRHNQFAAERLSRREDFRVSEALQEHMNELARINA